MIRPTTATRSLTCAGLDPYQLADLTERYEQLAMEFRFRDAMANLSPEDHERAMNALFRWFRGQAGDRHAG